MCVFVSRTLLGRGRHYHWDIENLPNGSVGDHGVTEKGRIEISGESVKALLHIEDE